MQSVEKMANQILRDWLRTGKVRCNCGGPQYGTDHSPDCKVVLAWDDAKDDARMLKYEAESEAEALGSR